MYPVVTVGHVVWPQNNISFSRIDIAEVIANVGLHGIMEVVNEHGFSLAKQVKGSLLHVAFAPSRVSP